MFLFMSLGVVPDKTWFLMLRSYSKDMCHQRHVAPSWFLMCRIVLFGSNNLCVFAYFEHGSYSEGTLEDWIPRLTSMRP
jgi:hypothetical protein